MEVHRNLPQRRHHIRVDGHVPGLAGTPAAAGLPHARHQRRHVLHHAGLIVRRHHRHQGRGGVAATARRRQRPIHRVELDPPRIVNLQQAQPRPQLVHGGTRRVQNRRVLNRRDHQPPARHRARPPRDHQGIGLRPTGGQQHLMRIHPQGTRQAGARLRQQRPHPPARSVLRTRIRPATQPTGQVLGNLLGDLGTDRGRGGMIEIGAHTPSLNGGTGGQRGPRAARTPRRSPCPSPRQPPSPIFISYWYGRAHVRLEAGGGRVTPCAPTSSPCPAPPPTATPSDAASPGCWSASPPTPTPACCWSTPAAASP